MAFHSESSYPDAIYKSGFIFTISNVPVYLFLLVGKVNFGEGRENDILATFKEHNLIE